MKIIVSTLSVLLLCALAIHTMPPQTVASTEALQPSFDIAMPALPEPVGPPEHQPVRLAAKT